MRKPLTIWIIVHKEHGFWACNDEGNPIHMSIEDAKKANKKWHSDDPDAWEIVTLVEMQKGKIVRFTGGGIPF